ncbi:uncharacterized protein LOC125857760 [Solanum stenotomum]|uniref:uncharacterized protein LOC125857760 n=1 Tax=Solanum stenotomum TaxID=172797 RepID=UPI0020D05627|nr:uncharacterized protein LOC125857760 [Solanum stenotomum]
MPSEVEIVANRDEDENEITEESKNATEQEEEITQKALEQMPGYAKFLKDLVTKKRAFSFENDEMLQHCNAIATRSLMQKKEDPSAFSIPCTIGLLHFAKALCDLGAKIILMSLSIYKKLGLGAPKPTAMRLLIADRTVKKSICVLQDVLMKVESFIFSADFVILDCEIDLEVPTILGRSFLATGRTLVDMERGQMKFRLNSSGVSIEERLGVDALAAIMMNFEGDGTEDYDELFAALDRFEFRSKPKKLELDMKNRDSPPAKPYVDEALKLELKALPSHLRYVLLGRDGALADDGAGPVLFCVKDDQFAVPTFCYPDSLPLVLAFLL